MSISSRGARALFGSLWFPYDDVVVARRDPVSTDPLGQPIQALPSHPYVRMPMQQRPWNLHAKHHTPSHEASADPSGHRCTNCHGYSVDTAPAESTEHVTRENGVCRLSVRPDFVAPRPPATGEL